ncbi:MAG: AraC family transcriptional regulator ligand-binding domain-containing protein [Pseudomonadota bacterium]
MGQITSLFAWKVIRQVDAAVDRRALLAPLGIDLDGDVDPSVMVSDTDYYDFFAAAAQADPDGAALPLRTGASMQCDEYGAFGLAWKSALNLRGSWERAERYARVLTSVAFYELEQSDEGVYLHLHRDGERSLGMRLSNEATLASAFAISQQVTTRPLKLSAVFFKHAGPDSTEAHEAHFGCPVYFASDRDAIRVEPETLLVANRQGDAGIAQFFDTHLQTELTKMADDSSLEQRVRIEVSRSLSAGVPRISAIAGRLGMSGRTLQRRLADRGYTFQDLVDESRRQLAERLLAQTRYPLAEISFLTGFSEQSAFNRAFKRWAGQTPRSFRLRSQS